MLYVAYFFPPRYAWPLAALEIATYASPLVTSAGPDHLLVAPRARPTPSRYAGLVATIQFLKRRLVAAERHQHRMARVDPLTGLANRRGFDEALDRALAAATASRCCSPTSTPSSRSTTASATRPATASCASWPPTPRPRSARATAWPGSAATSSRWSPRRRPRRRPPPRRRAARRPARASTPATAPSHSPSPPPSTPRTATTASRSCAPLDRELHAIKDARRV